MIYILIKIMKNTIIKTIVGFLTGVAITKISVTFNNSPIVTIEDNITNLKSKIIAYSENETKLIEKYNELYQAYTLLIENNSSSNEAIDLQNIEYLQEYYSNLENQIEDLNHQLEVKNTENIEQQDYIQSLENTIKELENKILTMEFNDQNDSQTKELKDKTDEIESKHDSVSTIASESSIPVGSNEE